MAEIAASVLAPAVESALKKVGAKIKRQFIYLFCFTSNIIGLEEEARSLNDKIQGVQALVNDEVTNNARIMHPEVTSWFEKSDKFITEMNTILNEVPNVKGGCLRFVARFCLSRKAKNTTEAIAQHRQKSNFENISLPPPAAATKEIPSGKMFSFDSRKKIEQDIMNTLRDKKETMIAIHGMGGLGKTTMAKRIMNALLNEKVFDEVVMAVVSQQVDELKIQYDIGGPLGLKDLKDEIAHQARAQILHARLTAGTTRTLLVLDDVWEELQLENLGIPSGSEGCTILITSRDSGALREMNVKNIFEMKELSKEDAWLMFRKTAGTCVDDKKLRSIAKEVVKECSGLPIALEALGKLLRDEKSKSIWRDTLKILRKPNPKNTPHYIEKVYNPLIVSYDKLDEEFKSPFLLCCLFREDANISVEYLTCFCMGLRLFEDLGSLGEVRDRMCSLVKMLKSRSLLYDGDEENHVRMHDVVRDVCIFIAKQKGYIGGNDCTWISSNQLPEAVTELSTDLKFLNLRLLFLDDKEFKIDNTFFEGTREFGVLSIKYYSLTSLPHTTWSLNNLRSLLLDSCYNLEAISVVGGLVHLEILICRWCSSIKELPVEIRGLKHLKLLELTCCENLQSIGRGIISCLVELEELKMFYSFDRWEAADLRELEALTKLICLEIQIADPALVSQEINLSSKLERFDIRFDDFYAVFPERSNKKMKLCLDEGACLGHWIKKLLKDAECIDVVGNGVNFQNYFPNIQWLKLIGCGGIKSIATTSRDDDDGVASMLEHLQLWNLPHLEEIWKGPANSLTFLQNLKNINLLCLPALKHLWKDNTNIVSLPQLEYLQIYECEMMEQLFLWNEENENETNKGSPNRDVTKIQGVKFPLLRKMIITQCPKMRYGSNSNADIDDHSSHLFCQPEKVSFGGLKELEIERNPFCHHNHICVSFFNELEKLSIFRYHGSLCLFTASVARNLVHLKELRIRYCDEMVAVIEDDKDEGITVSGGEKSSTLLFPKLQKLHLWFLPELEIFCEWDSDVELPLLEELEIVNCPNMTKFTLRSVPTPCLNFFKIDWYIRYSIYGSTDLNGALQKHFSKEKEIKKEDEDEYGDREGDASNGDGDVEIEKATKESTRGRG